VWSSRGVENSLNTVAVPTLTVGGTYDQEDMYGPQEEYARLEPHDAGRQNFLVLGPGGMAPGRRPRATWAAWTIPSPSARSSGADRGQVLRSLFEGPAGTNPSGFDLEDTVSFQTGSNTWKRYAHFPPKESQSTSLHLAGAGLLRWSDSTTAPKPAT